MILRKSGYTQDLKIDGDVPIKKVIEVDNAAWYTKQKRFEHFSHSRVDSEDSLEYNAYVGDYPLVDLITKRRFRVKDLHDGIPREYNGSEEGLKTWKHRKKVK